MTNPYSPQSPIGPVDPPTGRDASIGHLPPGAIQGGRAATGPMLVPSTAASESVVAQPATAWPAFVDQPAAADFDVDATRVRVPDTAEGQPDPSQPSLAADEFDEDLDATRIRRPLAQNNVAGEVGEDLDATHVRQPAAPDSVEDLAASRVRPPEPIEGAGSATSDAAISWAPDIDPGAEAPTVEPEIPFIAAAPQWLDADVPDDAPPAEPEIPFTAAAPAWPAAEATTDDAAEERYQPPAEPLSPPPPPVHPGGTAGWADYSAAPPLPAGPQQPPQDLDHALSRPAPPDQASRQTAETASWGTPDAQAGGGQGWHEYSDQSVPSPLPPGQLPTPSQDTSQDDLQPEPQIDQLADQLGAGDESQVFAAQGVASEAQPARRSGNRWLLVLLIGILLAALIGGGIALFANLGRIRGVGGPDRQHTLIDKQLPDDAGVAGLHWAGAADAPGEGILTMAAVVDQSVFELTAADQLAGQGPDNWQPTAQLDPALQGQLARNQLDTDLFLAALSGLSCPLTERDVRLQVAPTGNQFLAAGCRDADGAVRWESLAINSATLGLPAPDAEAIDFLLRLGGALLPNGEVASLNWQSGNGEDPQRFDLVGAAANDISSPRLVLDPGPWRADAEWWQVTETLEAKSGTPGVPIEQWQQSEWSAMLPKAWPNSMPSRWLTFASTC